MDLFKAIKERRSIRKFKKQEIPQAIIDKIIDAAVWAPSAGNVQPYALVLAQTEKTKQLLSKAAFGQKDIEEASAVVIVCADEKRAEKSYGSRGKNLYCLQDTAAAIQNMLLAAYSLGLGTCWIGAFKESEVKKVINGPDGMRPVAMIPIGYPNEAPSPTTRRSSNEIIHKEKF
jgi:nitroreductase